MRVSLKLLLGLAVCLLGLFGLGQTPDPYAELENPDPDPAAMAIALPSTLLPAGFTLSEQRVVHIGLVDPTTPYNVRPTRMGVYRAFLQKYVRNTSGSPRDQVNLLYGVLPNRLQASQALRGYAATWQSLPPLALAGTWQDIGDKTYSSDTTLGFSYDRGLFWASVSLSEGLEAQEALLHALSSEIVTRFQSMGFKKGSPPSVELVPIHSSFDPQSQQPVSVQVRVLPEMVPVRVTLFGVSKRDDTPKVLLETSPDLVQSNSVFELQWDGRDQTGQVLPAGSYQLGIIVLDSQGRNTPASTVVSVLDASGPPVAITATVVSKHVKPRKKESLIVDIHSNKPNVNYQFGIFRKSTLYASYSIAASADYRFEWNGVNPSGQFASNGNHTLVITATDAQGNQDVKSVDFVVND